jgi:hypothetical protein
MSKMSGAVVAWCGCWAAAAVCDAAAADDSCEHDVQNCYAAGGYAGSGFGGGRGWHGLLPTDGDVESSRVLGVNDCQELLVAIGDAIQLQQQQQHR